MNDNKKEPPAEPSVEISKRKNADFWAILRLNGAWLVLSQLSRRQWLYLPRLFTRREKVRILAVIAIALISFGFLSARLIRRVTVPVPAIGGFIREGMIGEPRFLNPVLASSDTDRGISTLVFSKLISYDQDGNVSPDLAKSVDISSDGKTYSLRLREGIKWHDGENFSADDVVFTVKVIQDPEYKSPLYQNWQGVAVEKISASEVRFALRQPYAPFLENLALGILPEHLWRKIPRETAALSDLNLKPIGAGPYKFKKFTRQENGAITSVVLERNSRFYLAGPYLKEVRLFFYGDEEKLVAAYRRNEIDSFAIMRASLLSDIKQLDLNIYELKPPRIFAAFLNASLQPALGRIAVRKALAMAIDREVLIKQAVSDGGYTVNSAIPSGTFGFNAEVAPIPYNPEEAKKLLAGDGWKEKDGALERSEGAGRRRTTQKLEIRITTSDAPELKTAAQIIAEMWQAIGVKTEVKIFNLSDLETSVIRPRSYEVLIFGEVFGHDPDPFAFWHTSQLKDPGLNIALYSNRAVDQLLEEARRANDAGTREQKYRDFQKMISDEIGAIFLYSPTQYYAIRKNIQSAALDAVTLPEERFNGISQWHIKTRRTFR